MDKGALLQFIGEHKRIYGAGANGALMSDALQDEEVKVSGFVVTRRKHGQVRFLGLPLMELNELENMVADDSGFVYVLDSKFHTEVTAGLIAAGFKNFTKNFFRIPDAFFRELGEKVGELTVSDVLSAWPVPKVDYLKPTNWRRILLLRLDGIGNVVLFTPFLRALSKAHPESEITLIVQPMVYNPMETCPYIDHLLAYDWHEDSGAPLRVRCRQAREYVQRQGVEGKYDIVLNPRWDSDYYDAGALAYFTKAPCRVAWSEHVLPSKAKLNCGVDEFYTMTLLDKRICHEVEHNLQFLTQLGINVLGEESL